MIKVCHMTSVHAPEDGRIFFKECTSLANAGYETYLVERGATYDKNGVHIVGVGDFQGNRLQRMLTLTKRVYETALKINAEIYLQLVYLDYRSFHSSMYRPLSFSPAAM